MVKAEDHIGYQPPNEYTRVQRQIKSIESTDISIVSDITTILGDIVKRENFEQAEDLLLLAASVCKNDTLDKKHHISAVNDDGSDSNKQDIGCKGFKEVDKGSSGVELRYHSFK